MIGLFQVSRAVAPPTVAAGRAVPVTVVGRALVPYVSRGRGWDAGPVSHSLPIVINDPPVHILKRTK